MDKDKKHIQDPLVSKEELENKDNLLIVKDLKKYFPIKKSIVSGKTSYVKAVDGVSFTIKRGTTMGLVGESGCGKSTFLKTLNRMNDLVPGVRIEGEVQYNGQNIFAPQVDVNELRRQIGMVFQKPNPFPMSIYDNVAYGPRTHGIRNKAKLDELVENAKQLDNFRIK